MEDFLKLFYYKVGLGAGRENTCGEKSKFPNEERATFHAQEISKWSGEKFMAYPCAFCKTWHIGHRLPFEAMLQLEKKGKGIIDEMRKQRRNRQ